MFAPNLALKSLEIPDKLIQSFMALTDYDFGTEVRVTVLGHIFEQSVDELEQLREGAEAKPESFIADLAKSIARLKAKAAERLTFAIAKHERELNAAVYGLFNLTPEEIALIEGG